MTTELEALVAVVDAEKQKCEAAIRDYMNREDYTNNIVFPAELHALRQHKNTLEAQRQFVNAKLNRIRFEGTL